MKTILITSTTFLIVIIVVGLVGLNNNNNINNDIGNALAQMEPEDSPMTMEDDMEMMRLNGTIDVKTTIAEALKSKVTTDLIGAIQAAQASVGANSFVKEAELTVM